MLRARHPDPPGVVDDAAQAVVAPRQDERPPRKRSQGHLARRDFVRWRAMFIDVRVGPLGWTTSMRRARAHHHPRLRHGRHARPEGRAGGAGEGESRERLTVDEGALCAYCRERIAGYECPRSVEFVDELPMTAARWSPVPLRKALPTLRSHGDGANPARTSGELPPCEAGRSGRASRLRCVTAGLGQPSSKLSLSLRPAGRVQGASGRPLAKVTARPERADSVAASATARALTPSCSVTGMAPPCSTACTNARHSAS